MAARAAQEVLTAAAALAFIERNGVVCEAARDARIPCLVEVIASTPLRGNWWSHPRAKVIFAITRAVRASAAVLTCRLVDGKITFVHERLWPALVRAADRFPRERLARVHEVHSASGKHVLEETPFPRWVPKQTAAAAARLSEAQALAALRPLAPS